MHSTIAAPAKIALDEYPRMQTGGWITLVIGVGGLLVLLTVGITTRIILPTGLASLTMGACTMGGILLVGRLVLMKLDMHEADHQQSALTVEDVERIDARLDSLDRRSAETHELLAHTSVCQAAPASQEPTQDERRAYAAGAVDVYDGRAAVVPLSGSPGLRIVPVQDPHRHA